MRDSAQALLRIIDDVLDFSKIEAGPARARSRAVLALRPDRRRAEHVPGAGGREGADAQRRGRARIGRHADRRSDPRAADPVQSARQCAEIHRARPRHGARQHRAARRRTHARDARGRRHRHRHRRGAAQAAVSAVRAGGLLDDAPLRRHRARPFDRAAARAADGRRHLGGERRPARARRSSCGSIFDAAPQEALFAATQRSAAESRRAHAAACRARASGRSCSWSTIIR